MASTGVIAAIIFASGKTSVKVCGNDLDKHAHTQTPAHINNETLRTSWCTINRIDAESRPCTLLSNHLCSEEKHALCKQVLAG